MPQNWLYQNPSVKIHNIQKTAMELKPQFIFVNLNICAWLNVNIARVFLCLLSCRLLAITDSKMDFAYLMHASGGGEGGTRVIVSELRQPEAFFCLHKAQTDSMDWGRCSNSILYSFRNVQHWLSYFSSVSAVMLSGRQSPWLALSCRGCRSTLQNSTCPQALYTQEDVRPFCDMLLNKILGAVKGNFLCTVLAVNWEETKKLSPK